MLVGLEKAPCNRDMDESFRYGERKLPAPVAGSGHQPAAWSVLSKSEC